MAKAYRCIQRPFPILGWAFLAPGLEAVSFCLPHPSTTLSSFQLNFALALCPLPQHCPHHHFLAQTPSNLPPALLEDERHRVSLFSLLFSGNMEHS